MLLNSFFLEDLARGRELQSGNHLGPALARHLGPDAPLQAVDLLEDKTELEAALAPQRTPAARWPTLGGHSLLQQAAVNVAFGELAPSSGIVGANGPPGTGKTTLLRDLVAAIVLDRARALATFGDPEAALAHPARAGIYPPLRDCGRPAGP